MWLLVTTMCLVIGPADAECRTEARVERSKIDCIRMIKPTKKYLAEEAEQMGVEVTHIFAGCKFGLVI